ncbi:MAG: cytochrome c-type biogenesis CcmF C-terminal domain-containing protein [Acidimicrobiia bacterium]|nr:cytochrome c-type biogenesis CcmF C-terminal domain-containing protein [Acidimicrobiia bacterium]
MIAVAGYASVLIALGASIKLVWDGWRAGRGAGNATAVRRDATVLFAAATASFVLLELAILTHDFSIEYVASNTATTTPFVFLLASGWAALEGSIVLWGFVLAGFTYLVARNLGDTDGLGTMAAAILGLVAVFWFGMMATVSDPFGVCTETLGGQCVASSVNPFAAAVAPAEGVGPNPLLQNHILMAVHPPMLYLGYVGMTVPFAFAIAALIRGDQGSAWLERTHRWTLIAWVFLTFGILLGAWWSYEVLGWGGYWAWDPVENAAFLPWLVGTAFIHSAVVQRRRGMLQAWNLILVIATFSLTIFGTFLTRSGTIFSVHSFTQSPIGPALLGFLGVIVVGSLALFAWRAHLVASSPRLDSLASREGVFLANNLLLALFAFTVLLGTLYPLLLEAFAGREVSVGRPFYDRATVPIAFALLLAMGVGPVTPYRVARGSVVWERTRTALIVALCAGAATVLLRVWSVAVVIVVSLAAFVIATILRHLGQRIAARRRSAGESYGAAFVGLVTREPGFWGGQLSHLGLALAAVAIATTSVLSTSEEVRIDVGQAAVVDGYCFVYEGLFTNPEPHRTVTGVDIRLYREDCSSEIGLMQPSVNRYPNATQPVGTPAVRTGLIDDVYLTITSGDANRVGLEILIFPFMWLLWVGGLLMVAGGFWAFVMRRRAPAAADPVEAVTAGDA